MCGGETETIRIVEETKTEYRYIKVASTCEDFKIAYESPIEISGTVNRDWLHVIASDGYKESEKGFRIGQNKNWNYVLCAGLIGIADRKSTRLNSSHAD